MKRMKYLTLILWLLASTASAAILQVPGPYGTIQHAIYQSAPGDTILLADGTYNEFVLVQAHPLTIASMFLLDQDQDHIRRTILAGAVNPASEVKLMTIDTQGAGETRLIGFSLESDIQINADQQSYVDWLDGPGEIRDCRFTGFMSGDYTTIIRLSTSDRIEFHSSRFLENECTSVISSRANILFEECEFSRNMNRPLNCSRTALTIRNCTFTDNRCDNGIVTAFNYDQIDSPILIEGNDFIQNELTGVFSAPVLLYRSLDGRVTNNRFIANRADMIAASGVQVYGTNPVEIDHNLFERNISYSSSAPLWLSCTANVHHNVFRENRGEQFSVGTISGYNETIPQIHFRKNLFFHNSPLTTDSTPDWASMLISYPEAMITIEQCDFVDNEGGTNGVVRFVSNQQDARYNFWGDPTGPYHPNLNPDGLGDEINLAPQQYEPFSTEQFYLPNFAMRRDTLVLAETLPNVQVSATIGVVNSGVQDLVLFATGTNNLLFHAEARFDTLHEGEHGIVDVFFLPTSIGRQEATISFSSNDPFANRDRLQVSGWCRATLDVDEESNLPERFSLTAPHPNPFNAETHFTVSLPTAAQLNIRVFDLLGREVAHLAEGYSIPGKHQLTWQAGSVSSGVYLLDVQTSTGDHEVQKLVLIR